jgi:serine/threonine protein kinase
MLTLKAVSATDVASYSVKVTNPAGSVTSSAAALSLLVPVQITSQPVAVTVANDAGLNPAILLILIGTCISLTFLNPIAHQTNLMVMGPGGYSTKTFVKFGIPVTIVTLAVGIAMGTLAYMAPEQFGEDPGAVDRRADVYAVGLLLFRALAGADLRREVDDVLKRMGNDTTQCV